MLVFGCLSPFCSGVCSDEYGLLIADRIPKERLGTVVSEAALDLCSKMLRRGAYNRISVEEALEHPYFSER